MRVYALYILVAFLSIYAYRNWFRSLCGLILLMAVIQHPDMPTNMLNIQGLNPWNILLANILIAWFGDRRRRGIVWDMPSPIGGLLLANLAVVIVGLLRMLADRSHLEEFTIGYLVSDNFINTVKWVIPGLLLFDGCRSMPRLKLAMASILITYALLAVQVIRWMPPSAAIHGDSLSERSLKIIQNEIGYSRVNMSMMLSGASWAILASLPLWKKRWHRLSIIGAFFMVAFAQALTGGRMGYVTWGMLGLILCVIKWRKFLLLLPTVPVLVALVLPGVAERMMEGFGESNVAGETYTNDYEVTAGRTMIWPYVIEEIGASPVIGHGRMAMARTGLRDFLWNQFAEPFAHPHNAYLQWLLDNGIVGFVIIMPLFIIVVVRSTRLFLNRENPYLSAAGGIALSLTLALLLASMGSQSFYPREGSVGMWAAIGVMLRLSAEYERRRTRAGTPQRAAVHIVGRTGPPREVPA